jgi:hypothetical protein
VVDVALPVGGGRGLQPLEDVIVSPRCHKSRRMRRAPAQPPAGRSRSC